MQVVGITSPVNIFLMQYLETQIVTGNALCVPKDELNRQGYTYKYNSWVGVLHVFTVNFMPFIKNRIYLQFSNCATDLTFVAQFMNGPCIVRTIHSLRNNLKIVAQIVNSQIAQHNL